MQASRIKQVLDGGQVGARVLVNGWVRTRRDSKGGFSFIELNDGSCMKSLQVAADHQLGHYESEALQPLPGACLSVVGALAAITGQGQSVELRAGALAAWGGWYPSYPLTK